jgi:hypothetical protein
MPSKMPKEAQKKHGHLWQDEHLWEHGDVEEVEI